MMQFRPSPETLPGQFPSPKRRTPRPVAPGASARRAPTRLLLEALEDRTLLSFSPAVSYAAGPYPFAVAAAD